MAGAYEDVSALTMYDGKLIAAGNFTMAGGVAASSIASWNGSSWSPLASGIGGEWPEIDALTVYDGKLIAGGHFTTAGGVATNYIASWDGSSWSPLGSGMNSYVHALTVYDGKLIAGGWFTTAGGVAADEIASWDGSNWSPLGSEIGGYVYALTVYDGKLIAGGTFNNGGVPANYIASWDGSSWSPLGSGMNHYVFALTVYGGKLIAGGYFDTAGGEAASGIASWDGSSWSPLASGMGGEWPEVDALTVYSGKIIAGGSFTTAGGATANSIASWNGSSWSPLGSGTGGYIPKVSALTVHDGKLIAGGWFTIAGNKVSAYLARWTRELIGFCDTLPSTVDLCDPFDTSMVAGWTETEGTCTWQIIDSTIQTSLSGQELSCVLGIGDTTWGNYVFGCDIRGNAGSDKIARFRHHNDTIRYFVNLRSDWQGEDELFIGKQIGGTQTILQTVSYPSQNGTWYRLTISCIDEHIVISMNGVEVLDIYDGREYIPSGGIGLVCFTGEAGICDISFDNVHVTLLPRHNPGDANGDSTTNIGDAVYLVNYIFKGGESPESLAVGDANCDGYINIGDAVYIINYIFKGGPVPCAFTP